MKNGKLLCPVDFSVDSYNAVRLGVHMAQQFSCEIEFLHIVSSFSEADIQNIFAEASVRMQKLVCSFTSSDPKFMTTIRIGEPYEEIIKRTHEESFSGIVISAHGQHRITQLLVGDTCEQVMRHATCPVIVLRTNQPESSESSDFFLF